ncbi:hypothetical protein CBR_g18964 [Chara braunii]|uniref:Uncharacterized protein n=1 Tax=Chara braunii TaxID=69332 RepID=A0A388KX71_CHABU|nr:hypothetical protein CBR_g18964 [Chara braunii]|eukprot:GBG74553.1 hypothetical protein CBR_g18964 [Chara braunii]
MGVTLRCKVVALGDAGVGKTSLVDMLNAKGASFPKNYKMTAGVSLVVVPIPLTISGASKLMSTTMMMSKSPGLSSDEDEPFSPLGGGGGGGILGGGEGRLTRGGGEGRLVGRRRRGGGGGGDGDDEDGKDPVIVELYIFDVGGQEIFRELAIKYLDNASMVLLIYDTTNIKSFENCDKWLQLLKKCRGDRVTPGALIGAKIDLTERRHVSYDQGLEFAQSNGLEFFECSSLPPGMGVEQPFLHIANQFYRAYQNAILRMSRS